MSNSVGHAALPYPIRGCRFTVAVPYLDADGDPTDPTTPDTEVSKDGGAFADCSEEVTTISGSNGMGYLTLTGDETNCSLLALCAKVASGPKATLLACAPRVLPTLRSGTAQAGAAGTITLDASASAIDNYYVGCILQTTGGTGGGGGSGSANNQARVITAYNGSTKVASVSPNWETNPDNTTTFAVLAAENAALVLADVVGWRGTGPAAPNTAGVPLVDVARINNVATTSVTTVGANIGTTQPLNFTGTGGSALVKSDIVDVAGAAVDTSLTQFGVRVVSYIAGQAPLQPTVAGRTLDVSSGGEAGLDWANIGSPTTTQNLSGTSISASGLRTAVGLAAANLDTQLAAIAGFIDTEIAALPTAAQNAAALLDLADGIETNRTLRQGLRLILAALVGKLSGAASGPVLFRDSNDTKDRISITGDADGNRTAVTLDAS